MQVQIFFQTCLEISFAGLYVELRARFWWMRNRGAIENRLSSLFQMKKYSALFKDREVVMVWLSIDEYQPARGAEFPAGAARCSACEMSFDRKKFYRLSRKNQLESVVKQCRKELDRFLLAGPELPARANCSGVWELSFAMQSDRDNFKLRRQVEDFLSRQLSAHALGVVEGSQIGSGSFEIFVEIESDMSEQSFSRLLLAAMNSEGYAQPVRFSRADAL